MIDLIDTHCHIQEIGITDGDEHIAKMWSDGGISDIQKVIDDAKKSNVNKLIIVGCDYPSSARAVELAEKYDNCFASVGIHPYEAKTLTLDPQKLEDLKKLTDSKKVIAIGECGLDYHHGGEDVEKQKKIFEMQLELAKSKNLPVIFHVRDGFDDFWPIYEKYTPMGVLHSYTDSLGNLDKALRNNLLIGINGISTFTSDQELKQVHRSTPLTNIVLETDSPYLAPWPIRGKVNTPAQVHSVAEFLAKEKDVSIEDIATSTTANAQKLFKI
ncbi:MAG TPA: TatD family hydrolase [Candidatus Sulfotelmatobacter sp.]|nr:TatD family hydrolase [Candidatus Sulfotelmatobacter sp.]